MMNRLLQACHKGMLQCQPTAPVPRGAYPPAPDLQKLGMRPPVEWFAKVTVPLVDEFIGDPTSLHRTVSAVREVFHFHERLWWYWSVTDPARIHNTTKVEAFLNQLKEQAHAFSALQIASNATKHHVLKNVQHLPQGMQITVHSTAAFQHGIATATEMHRTIGDGDPDTLASILEAMKIYRAYL